MRAAALTFLFTLGCAPSYVVLEPLEGIEGPSEEQLDALWGAAEMIVLSPESGAFVPIEEPAVFEAIIVDEDGVELPFDEITWKTDLDEEWRGEGAGFEAEDLPVGTQTFTAVAQLPNGDRLVSAVGGVLVQSRYAGTYAGTLSIDTTIQTYQIGCSGATTAIIVPEGDEGTGGAGCSISLQGFDLDLVFNLELENDDGEIGGVAAVDVFGYEYPLEIGGEITPDGHIVAEFSGDVFGATFAGTLEAVRISRDTSGGGNG